jgi:hypothetical protein
MRIHRPKDFYAGLMFLLFGAAAMYLSAAYKIGTAAKMGPGYFPFALGILLSALGAAIMAHSILWARGTQKGIVFQLKPPLLVLSSVVLFGLLLRPMGLVLATVLLVVVSSMASHEFRLRDALLSAFALAGVVLAVFVYALDFQVPVWPAFLNPRH